MLKRIATALAVLYVVMSQIALLADDKPTFKITPKRETDKVELKVEKDGTVFSVHSQVGIGQAVIERTNEKWPDVVVLRLYLKGLESFRATNDKVTLDAAVSSHDDKQRVRLWKDGKEDSPLDAKSPFWMEIRMIGADGKPAKAVPLKDGYFEMTLPKSFFEGNPKALTINWIDFHR